MLRSVHDQNRDCVRYSQLQVTCQSTASKITRAKVLKIVLESGSQPKIVNLSFDSAE